jgi:cytochrome c oxidase assembly factor CtaG
MALHEIVHMTGMGLLVSVAAPALVLLGRHLRVARAGDLPVWLVLPGFVVLHGALILVMEVDEPSTLAHAGLDLLLLAGAVLFWLPVLGVGRHRLDDAGRCVYLFVAAPALDLAGVIVVARGNSAGGLAMIVAMLPIGLVAVGLTWQWLRAEEALAAELDRAERAARLPEVPRANS